MRKKFHLTPQLAGLLAGMCLVATTTRAEGQQLSAANSSRYVGNGRWDWTVFIKGPPEILKNVSCVEYTLHPSFPKPIRKVCSLGDKDYPFGLSSNGWGVFEISIKVVFKNGDVRPLKHMLSFDTPAVEQPLPIKTGNTAKQVREDWWNWTVFIEGPEEVLDKVRCVEYTLHPTFANPVSTICDRGKGSRGFSLTASGWGTFEIGIRVFLKDGRVQKLTHNLKF